jgi:hypothetical protein
VVAKYRLPDGTQVKRKVGPAWTGRGRASVSLPLVRLVRGACQALMREVNAFDSTRCDALGAQQVLSERSQRGDARWGSLEMLKRSGRLGDRCDGVAVEPEVALRDLVRDEDLVRTRTPCLATAVRRVSGPQPLLGVAERDRRR